MTGFFFWGGGASGATPWIRHWTSHQQERGKRVASLASFFPTKQWQVTKSDIPFNVNYKYDHRTWIPLIFQLIHFDLVTYRFWYSIVYFILICDTCVVVDTTRHESLAYWIYTSFIRYRFDFQIPNSVCEPYFEKE